MRALAEQLDTSTPTLYRHVDGKDDLMVHVVDKVLGVIAPTAEKQDSASWQEATRARLLRLHDALSSRPKLLPLLAARSADRPQRPCRSRGCDQRASRIWLRDRPRGPRLPDARPLHRRLRSAAARARRADPCGGLGATKLLPEVGTRGVRSTRAAAQALTGVSARDEFLEGLQFILGGIESQLTEAGTTPA
jgi:AcrR family transcriptional regulator